ncbi:hypothetical protein F5B21DRAFT_476506 [Xylaria acuta]|nr:hypothetical protein F5B21DRAFT_476506 [Xylaria acuta]
MRKRITQEPEPRAGDDQRWKPEDETNKQQDGHETPASATRGSSPSSARSEVAEHWVHQAGEWPWRVEQEVQRDPSKKFRVLSVLEVNDLCYYAMQWERMVKPEDMVVPQTQRPFPHQEIRENEVDELMDYLTRP